MARRLRSRGLAAVAGAMVVSGPVIAGCGLGGPTYDEWAATDGAAGRINLDAVQDAFKKSKSPTEFERLVNEIYEGDGLVLIRSKQDGDRLTLDGFEDLNGNGAIDDKSDDLLFSVVKEGEAHQLRGHGANGYYNRGFGGGDFLFTYLMISSLSPRGYYYQTPPGTRSTMSRNRSNYRNTPRYRSQVSKNTNYFGRQKNFQGSKYASASRNVSQGRRTYQSTQRQSGAFKKSGTGVRSSWGSRSGGFRGSSRGGRGGFRGFGGAQGLIGPRRG